MAREFELKAVVADPAECVRRIRAAGGRLTEQGRLEDRRWDNAAGDLGARDEVLRLRVLRMTDGAIHATMDWKGPTGFEQGYKVREELSFPISDPDGFAHVLERLGFRVIHAIDRDIEMYEVPGGHARIERYPRMDVLVEVEGAPETIERAIAATGIPREEFSTDRLTEFAARFAGRTGQQPFLSEADRSGRTHG